MMRAGAWVWMTLAIATMAAQGCGSTTRRYNDDDNNGGNGGTGGGGGMGGMEPLPPPCQDGVDTVLGMNKLLLGETNRDGSPNATSGWRQYGVNLDGRISDVSSMDLCKPFGGAAPSDIYPDGNNGIDNSFGKNILPVLLGLTPEPTLEVNTSIQNGDFTLMLKVNQLGASTTCTATSNLYGGAALGSIPQFNGTDVWPLDPVFLSDPSNIDSAKNVFLTSVINNNGYRSGLEANFSLELPVSGYPFVIPIRHARFEMQIDPDHTGATVGNLAGIIDTEVFVTEFKKMIGAFDPSLCSGSTVDGIVNQLRQANDIMLDGTQDPSQECNAISIGLGFEMRSMILGPVAAAKPPVPDPCAP